MSIKTTTTVKYEIAVSDEEYSPNGWYPEGSGIHGFSFYTYNSFKRVDPRLLEHLQKDGESLRVTAIAWADKNYGPTANTPNGSYQLRETTHTVTVVDEEDKKERLKSRTESTHVVIFHETFRTQEQMEEFYLKPLREWEAKAPEREAQMARIDARIAQARAEEEATRLAEEEAKMSAFGRFTKRLLSTR